MYVCMYEWNLTRTQGVGNIRERYAHKARNTNLAGVCLQGKFARLDDQHHQPNVIGLRASCDHQQQREVKGYDVALQPPDVIKSVPGAGYVIRDKPGIIDSDVAPRSVNISNVAVSEPG